MSEQAEVVVLTRNEAIKNSTDPQGREWKVKFNRGTALLSAEPEPYRENFQVPMELVGKFTSTKQIGERIELYLNRAWDIADAAALKSERAAKSKSEAKRKAVQTKSK
jgi:hypothetical protein